MARTDASGTSDTWNAVIAGLARDASRPERKPPLSPATIERVVYMTWR